MILKFQKLIFKWFWNFRTIYLNGSKIYKGSMPLTVSIMLSLCCIFTGTCMMMMIASLRLQVFSFCRALYLWKFKNVVYVFQNMMHQVASASNVPTSRTTDKADSSVEVTPEMKISCKMTGINIINFVPCSYTVAIII